MTSTGNGPLPFGRATAAIKVPEASVSIFSHSTGKDCRPAGASECETRTSRASADALANRKTSATARALIAPSRSDILVDRGEQPLLEGRACRTAVHHLGGEHH